MEPSPPSEPLPPKRAIDDPRLVLLALFLGTGCLGIPLLFLSRGFGPTGRLLWSIVSVIYTALLLWGFVLIMQWCWGEITRALA